MNDTRNTILAVVLSGLVLLVWQYFYVTPVEKRHADQAAQTQVVNPPGAQNATPSQAAPGTPPAPQATPSASPPAQSTAPTLSREAAVAATPRVKIDTPSLLGSIALRGGRIDDLSLKQYRETVDPTSPAIVLLSPSGAPDPYYAEFGWVPANGVTAKIPDQNTVWTQDGSDTLTPQTPVNLRYDNGEGLVFHRNVSIDDRYLFTIKDTVENRSGAAVTLYPYALISRHGTPKVAGYYVLHEGMVGVLGDKLQEVTYKTIDDKKALEFPNVTGGWFGITDKYWAAALLPDTDAKLQAHFRSDLVGTIKTYQTDYLLDPQTIQAGGTGAADARLFAGAKEVATVGIGAGLDNLPLLRSFGGYNEQLHLNKFDLLIDWGWFYFITKPMFLALDGLFRWVGNFGIAILLLTAIVKLIFFPLANKSYASMAKMKAVQPQLTALRERYPDDKVKQQQEMMELYKKEKINPLAGCLPIVIQIPVFFSLYKVLFVSIEMRHAPFYGWIHDLSAPDPTNIFTLFGLIAVDPSQIPLFGHYLVLGAWPIIMGITMWFQTKLNPTPPDPTQKLIFDWMPVLFTFMLSSFSAGLVIYWAWNNTLSVTQQSFIMKRNGAKIELFDNLKALFKKKTATGSDLASNGRR
jgi:YidC/Oxa1 family membrane protein insertase